MKKLLAFCIFITVSLLAWAQDNFDTPEKPPFRMKNRMVELSLAAMNINMASDAVRGGDFLLNPIDMLRTGRIFEKNVVINIDDLLNGVNLYSNMAVKPFSFNFNWKDDWGIGLDIAHIDVTGGLLIPRSMVTQQETEDEKFGLGGAVFVDVGVPVFFHVNEFKIKFRPAAYVPVLYTESNNRYTYKTSNEGIYAVVNYDMRVYSPVRNMDDAGQDLSDNAGNIPKDNMGYDFRLGVEYPMNDELDIGVDIVNIPVPFAAARLNHYSRIQGEAFLNTENKPLGDLFDGKELTKGPDEDYYYPEELNVEHGLVDPDGKEIYRPFKMLFYANYRPSDTLPLSLIPSFGFSINHIYPEIFSFEGGLSARYDFANIFIPALGINYTDRIWKGSIDLVFNSRAFELDIGVSSQSLALFDIFQGKGIGITTGIKLGW